MRQETPAVQTRVVEQKVTSQSLPDSESQWAKMQATYTGFQGLSLRDFQGLTIAERDELLSQEVSLIHRGVFRNLHASPQKVPFSFCLELLLYLLLSRVLYGRFSRAYRKWCKLVKIAHIDRH